MQYKKITKFEKYYYKYKFKLKDLIFGKKPQHVSSTRITIRNNHILDKNSDYNTVCKVLNGLGIKTEGRSIQEVEQDIDKKIMESVALALSQHDDDTTVKHISEDYVSVSENRNLMMLKYHINVLKSWTKNQPTDQPIIEF
ncbi:hypothetical protein ITJ86_15530 [Winogradskyella sp. F6397]|uniref:Uncharacterized protein n=1 Tax=Winogradskyella marina TaxID=2785530 RepID=A0ABS0ELM0_9FLAO|nr:hypothetical protein [Winogradskyella marina]MBF8151318.1 hypothetical protein [Winogradskyella marina]